MSLKKYNEKRNFNETPEPPGDKPKENDRGLLRFVVQMHAATRLHFDLRLEMDGVFRSWAVPKGPSLNPLDQRLAVYVEDHPIEYGSFEGVIPKGNYGAGTVMVWDHGTYLERGSSGRDDSEAAMLKGLESGHMTFILEGEKLRGEFALVKLKGGSRRGSPEDNERSWLLLKKRDGFAAYVDVTKQDHSVKTGRSMKEIETESPGQGAIWLSGGRKQVEPRKFVPKAKPPKRHLSSAPKPVDPPARERTPRRIKPMLPTAEKDAFDEPGWIFELHGNGYRAIAEVENGKAHLYSRQLLSFDKKFPDIVAALRKIPTHLVLDGEVIQEEDRSVYYAFDLLHLEGMNWREQPLAKRKEKLAGLQIFGDLIRYRPHVEATGLTLYHQAQDAGIEALLAKDAASLYSSGTSKSWIKVKVSPKKVSVPKSTSGSAKSKSAPGAPPSSPLNQPQLTNLDKIYWPKEGYTKGDLIEYYRKVSRWILPHLKDRPESLHRHPNGITGQSFFQKDVQGHLPRWVDTKTVFSESADKSVNYLICQNEETLLYMANLGCIELNPWISRVGSLENPDYAIIDLDPDTNDFSQVITTAQEVHRILSRIGAISFCKTSGATGLHICIPTGARYTYDEVRIFAEKICGLVHERLPDFTSVERNPAKRRGRIYLDFLQNRRGQTLAAPYCVRPRPLATVSTPLHWHEVVAGLSPEKFTIETILKRIEKEGDLWKPTLSSSVNLAACAAELEDG